MSHEHERDEWRSAVHAMTEADRAPFDDRETYADTFDLEGQRYGYR